MINGGMIPGVSVRAGGEVIGMGLSMPQAIALARQHDGEIWGYGKTTHDRFPDGGFVSHQLAYFQGGEMYKTNEWRRCWDSKPDTGSPAKLRMDDLEHRLRGR